MDGGPNRVFPNYVVDVGQHAKMGLSSKATPALVLYDTVRKRPIPIGTGSLSADEITERIFTLTSPKAGSDFRSDERRVGKECASTVRSRGPRDHLHKTTYHIRPINRTI